MMMILLLLIAFEVPIAPQVFAPHPQQSAERNHQQLEVEEGR